MDEATARAVDEMYDGVVMLSTIYTITPLLGLLGTILGLRTTFYDFAIRQEKSISALSVGIQEALITTMWGLFIAVPAYVAVQWLQSIIRRYERRELPAAVREALVTIYSDPNPVSQPDVIGNGMTEGNNMAARAESRA